MAEPSPAPSQPPLRVHPPSVGRHLARRLLVKGQGGHTTAPWLHAEIARRMAERLDAIKVRPASVLDWWSVLGGGAESLTARYPQARLTAVEPRSVSTHLAAARRPWWQRLTKGAAPPPLSDDAPLPDAELLWANMMLHWVDDLPPLLQRWHAALATDGFLMFSCFGPDTLRELHALYAAEGWPAPSSRFIDMHDLGDALVHAGFADPVMDMELLTLTWPDAEALLTELRSLGGNTAPQRPAALRGRQWRARLTQALTERLAGPDGRLRLTFEIVYGHAFKPAPRVRAAARTEVGLDEMRRMVGLRSTLKHPSQPE